MHIQIGFPYSVDIFSMRNEVRMGLSRKTTEGKVKSERRNQIRASVSRRKGLGSITSR
jgi:hypothetical protein